MDAMFDMSWIMYYIAYVMPHRTCWIMDSQLGFRLSDGSDVVLYACDSGYSEPYASHTIPHAFLFAIGCLLLKNVFLVDFD